MALGMVGGWNLGEVAWTGQLAEGGGGVGLLKYTDRLMAPALHTIEFAPLALGKGLSSWELSCTPRATGPGSAGPDSIRRNKRYRAYRQPSTRRSWWLSPER